MQRFARNLLVAALAAGVCGSALGQTTLSLNAEDACLNAGDKFVTVRIDMTGATDLAVGGQFFLEYDTSRLTFIDAVPGSGSFTMEIFQADDPMSGTIDYAVGVPFGGPGSSADQTMAVLTFAISGDACDVGSLVSFRVHSPSTRVTNGAGDDILGATNNLGIVRIDSGAPTLTLSSGLEATDGCADAPSVPEGTFNFSTSAATYSASDGGGSCGSSGATPDVWYTFVPTADGSLNVSVCGLTGYDTVLEAMTGCGGAVIACNDDTCGLQSTIQFNVQAWIPVKIRVSGFAGSTGSGRVALNFFIPPPPLPSGPAAVDTCASAPAFGEGLFAFNTAGATNDGGANACTSGATPADVWIQYVPSFTGSNIAETCGISSSDTVLHAYTACGGTLLACNDDTCSLQSRITFPVTTGVPVWVRVTRFAGGNASGSVRIPLPPPPPEPPAPAFTLDRVVKADAGGCTAVVTFGATATDDCDAKPGVVCDPPSGSAFPVGTTSVLCTATDACGNFVTGSFNVTVLPVSELVADVELAGVSAPVSRCITFGMHDLGGCPVAVESSQTLRFQSGRTHSIIDVPCGAYQCATARDVRHTLRRTDDDGDFAIVGPRYVCNFTSSGSSDDSLVGGNFNDDQYIEILDFGIFAGQFGANYGSGNTPCGSGINADASGDGLVTPADFTFIQTAFLRAREADCCGGLSTSGPNDRIPVGDLDELGYPDAIIADFTRDGWLDTQDVIAFLNGARPCASDWNRDARVNSADFFNFLSQFFTTGADFNRDGVTTSQDFFDFLTAFLSGC